MIPPPSIIRPKQGSTDGDTHTVYIGPDGKEYRSLRLVKRLLEQEEREKSKKKLRRESDSESSSSVSSRKRTRTSTTGRTSGIVKRHSNVPRQRKAKRVANSSSSSSDSEEKADDDEDQGDRDKTHIARETKQNAELKVSETFTHVAVVSNNIDSIPYPEVGAECCR